MIRELFVHGRIDDFGFTPNQFRVLCHIARRDTCYASADSMAKHCRIHKNTLWAVLKFLCDHNIIQKTKREGQPSIYTVLPPEVWKPLESPPHSNSRAGRPKSVATSAHGESTAPPPQTNSRKVHPKEEDPLKGEVSSPYAASTDSAPPPKSLYPREYNELITEAKAKISEYSGDRRNWVNGVLRLEVAEVIELLRDNIHKWTCAKLGISALPRKPSRPQPPPASSHAPTANQKAGLANVTSEDWRKGIEDMYRAVG